MSAIEGQVDGTHYNSLTMQPIQLGYMVNASPCFVKLAKYIVRDKGDKQINLDKAIHVARLEEELIDGDNLYFAQASNSDEYEWVHDQYVIDSIFKYASQFQEQALIADALVEMYYGHYDTVVAKVEQLKEIYQ